MNDSSETMPAPSEPKPAQAAALGPWLRQGARTALFLRPDWRGLVATPALLAILVLAGLSLVVLIERLQIVGPARFYGPGLMAGWLPTVAKRLLHLHRRLWPLRLTKPRSPTRVWPKRSMAHCWAAWQNPSPVF